MSEEFYGESAVSVPVFSVVEMQKVLNDKRCIEIELDASQSLVRKLQGEIEERKSGFTQTNAGLLKFIDEQAETVKYLTKELDRREETIRLLREEIPGEAVFAWLSDQGYWDIAKKAKAALLATAKEK